jgi:hypothetical protein
MESCKLSEGMESRTPRDRSERRVVGKRVDLPLRLSQQTASCIPIPTSAYLITVPAVLSMEAVAQNYSTCRSLSQYDLSFSIHHLYL